MTVCIAALCDKGQNVICVSDRMLTSTRQVEFEPPITKVWSITDSVVVLIAGDAGVQAELSHRVSTGIKELDDDSSVSISDVVDLYAKHYGKLRQEAAERDILVPLGLDHESYLARSKEFGEDLVRMVADALMEYRLPRIETLIAAAGEGTGGLYRIVDTSVSSCHCPGFACIGSGGWVAESQFMLGGHSARNGFPETLWLTYLAKRRAEVVSGVGKQTDVFILPPIGEGFLLDSAPLAELEKMYEGVCEQERKAVGTAQSALRMAFNDAPSG